MSSGVFQESVPSTHKVRDTLVHHNLTDDDQPAFPHDWHLTVAGIHTIRANWIRVRFSKRSVHLNPGHDDNGLRDTLPATPRHSQLYVAAKVVAGLGPHGRSESGSNGGSTPVDAGRRF